jgi:hypothetical protein
MGKIISVAFLVSVSKALPPLYNAEMRVSYNNLGHSDYIDLYSVHVMAI